MPSRAPGSASWASLGVLWPAKKFTDPDEIVGGGAGIGDEAEGLKAELEGFFAGEEAANELARAKALVDRIEDDDAAAAELAELIRRQATGGAADADTDSAVDRDFLEMSGSDLLESLSAAGAEPDGDDDFEGGGAAGFFGDGIGNLFGSVFDRTRSVLNYSTYYTMKRRAGKVGENGLNQVLEQLAAPGLRLHLVGHSFGGKVVTSAANGPDGATDRRDRQPVAAAGCLLAQRLRQELPGDRDGAYRPVVAGGRLKGPVIVTHTKNDDAVKRPYALASRLAGQDAAGVGGAGDRFGAIGSNGAQFTPEVDPGEAVLRDPGEPLSAWQTRAGSTTSWRTATSRITTASRAVQWPTPSWRRLGSAPKSLRFRLEVQGEAGGELLASQVEVGLFDAQT